MAGGPPFPAVTFLGNPLSLSLAHNPFRWFFRPRATSHLQHIRPSDLSLFPILSTPPVLFPTPPFPPFPHSSTSPFSIPSPIPHRLPRLLSPTPCPHHRPSLMHRSSSLTLVAPPHSLSLSYTRLFRFRAHAYSPQHLLISRSSYSYSHTHAHVRRGRRLV